MYVIAQGEKSICVYSFDTDQMCEINLQMGQNDRLYFDVGVKRILVHANVQLGEFTVVYLPQNAQQKAITFATIRNCSYAVESLISCSPQLETKKVVVVCHLGEDRSEFVVTELSPPDEADDFTEPLSVICRMKHNRIIDWIDMAPSGKYAIIRDVSGAIMVFVIATQQLIDISPTLGNGVVMWATPFDVIIAQEAADSSVIVYYNPGDVEDKPQLINVPGDNQGWTLTSLDNSQV